MDYCHITRDANCVTDDMARRALEAQATITLWDRQVPKDAPGNQLQDVYEWQGIKSWLDWVSLPKPFNWTTNQPNLQPDVTVASIFGQRYAVRVAQSYLWEVRCKAAVQLARLLKWTEAYLIQQTRPQAWLTGSPVVPLVCSKPLAGMKLPCLDGTHQY